MFILARSREISTTKKINIYNITPPGRNWQLLTATSISVIIFLAHKDITAMEKIFDKSSALKNEKFLISEIIAGKIFIYPTDTLYGLGINALDGKYIEKIRSLKKRDSKPFLIIAPGLDWILENCVIPNEKARSILTKKLPGPYSFILKMKNRKAVSHLAIGKKGTIGVRLPDHWFSEIILKSGIPFVSTSVNISGKDSGLFFNQLSAELKESADYQIRDDFILGRPSTIIDLTDGKEKILRA
jgi:L-threonylcarbamoyladenylate synthase